MLTEWTDNSLAITTRQVWDITEEQPIPRGAVVELQDFDPWGGDDGLWVIEYQDRIYLAEPDELKG